MAKHAANLMAAGRLFNNHSISLERRARALKGVLAFSLRKLDNLW
jgi:hypothetical protein